MEYFPKRKRLRLKGYDYSRDGYYFVTICVKYLRNLLGHVGRDVLIAPDVPIEPEVQLSEYGNVVSKHINIIDTRLPGIWVDKYVIMPNHIHMIIVIDQAAGGGAIETSRPTLSGIIRSFKTMVTKEIGVSVWQTSFHDRIIRNEAEYRLIWQYIDENPAKWQADRYFR